MFEAHPKELRFRGIPASQLIEEYGSPLYLYDEQTVRENCRKLKAISSLPNFRIYYSAKANSNISLLKIIREEGLWVDAMTVGEIHQERLAGFSPEQILFLSNNVSAQDFRSVQQQGIRVCLDSIDQIKTYGEIAQGGKIYIRINPGEGKGAGHHQKVVTAGKVKFGIDLPQLEQAFAVASQQGLQITGFMIHIGSLFLSAEPYLNAIQGLLELAKQYPEIEYLDFGGGIGIPYHREESQDFPFAEFSQKFNQLLQDWMKETGRTPIFAMEPGRFVVAEAGACLTQVQAVKENAGIHFAGTDLGFNFLIRPEFYGSFHEILKATRRDQGQPTLYTVVGNVCESGDNVGKDRLLPALERGDLLMVRDTGAYGYAMASNYNSMGRPAEVLIHPQGKSTLIRRREGLEDLIRNQTQA